MATYIFNGECPSSIKQAFIDAYKPAPAYHADTWYKYANDTEWRTASITGAISGSSSTMPTTQIPNIFSVVALEIGSDVTSIGTSAFFNCEFLLSVTITDSVTSIGEDAFRGCSGLTSVTIPDSVTTIGSGAFYGCSGLTSVTIPDGVTRIGVNTFSFTSITELNFPNSVQTIGSNVCVRCSNLSSVSIGNGIISIDYGAFNLTNVTQIYIQKTIAETQVMDPPPVRWMYMPGGGEGRSGSVTITCTDGSFVVTWSDDGIG